MNEYNYTKPQLTALLLLRFFTGWHILYEGIAKAMNPQWTSFGFLQESQWVLAGFSGWVTSNPSVLAVVDFMNVWGLIAIGLGLIVGLFFKVAAVAGFILVLMYWMNSPALVGVEYSMPVEGHNLIVNKTLIQAGALLTLALFSTSKIFGLDALIGNFKRKGEVAE